MTDTEATPAEAPSAEVVSLIQKNLEQVEKGKISLGDLFNALSLVPEAEVVVEPVRVPEILPEHRVALTRFPEVYGKVRIDEPRLLTEDELAALADERDVIDKILEIAKSRKEKGIRETVAHHFDKHFEATGAAFAEDVFETAEDGEPVLKQGRTPRDAHGHFLLKGEVPVASRGQKFVNQLAQKKPTLTAESLLAAEKAGVITHEEYISLTTIPEAKRQPDELKIRKVLKKDPALLLRLAKATVPGSTTASILLKEDKG